MRDACPKCGKPDGHTRSSAGLSCSACGFDWDPSVASMSLHDLERELYVWQHRARSLLRQYANHRGDQDAVAAYEDGTGWTTQALELDITPHERLKRSLERNAARLASWPREVRAAVSTESIWPTKRGGKDSG